MMTIRKTKTTMDQNIIVPGAGPNTVPSLRLVVIVGFVASKTSAA